VGYEDRHGESIDDLDVLLAALPPEIVDAVHATPAKTECHRWPAEPGADVLRSPITPASGCRNVASSRRRAVRTHRRADR